ncbi:MAG: nuclear transport factor 2 family protein [Deltaproteobacteria bacterium]|nr:nuclear transport factor 2 family protein [Deltaproteobacteria bacterium]
MRKKAVHGFPFIFILLFCLYVNPSANAASVEENVLKVENNWVKAFNNMDFKLMSSLYWHSPDTEVFSPSVFSKEWADKNAMKKLAANSLSNGWDSIESILKEYCEQPKGTFTWSVRDMVVTMLADKVVMIIGYHDLIEKTSGGEPTATSLRFTHVIKEIGGKWVIVHCHETKLQSPGPPDTTAPAPATAQATTPAIPKS